MAVRGIGQRDDSPVSKSAMLLSTACAVVNKDLVYAQTFADPFAERFAVAISDEAQATLDRLNDDAARAAFIADWEEGIPGLITHVVYRKPWIERATRDAIAAGVRQVVILGAGCDTLSLRLGEALGEIPVFEIDRPDVIDFRRTVLHDMPALPPGLHLVGINFDTETLAEPLLRAGYQPEVRTVFVAEGVMEYLSDDDACTIFDFVQAMAPAGSRFVFTFLARQAYSDHDFEKLKDELDKGGEPLKFGLVPDLLDAFLADRGMYRLDFASPETIRETIVLAVGALVDIIPGFHFVVAETLG